MRVRLFVLAGVLLSLLTVPASAQDQGCVLELQPAEDNATTDFEPGEQRHVTFVVENTGQSRAEGQFVVTTSPPPGWFWDTQSRKVNVPADAQAQEEVTLSVIYEGDQARPAQLQVDLQDVRCPTPLTGAGLEGDAVGGPLSVDLQPAASVSSTPVDEGPGLMPWVLFGVVVLGTAVGIPAYYQRNRTRIEAFCEDPEREVVAGRGTSFPVVLRNKAKDPAHVALEVTEVQDGWSALTTLPDLELGPKESRTLYMMVRAPEDARAGDLCVTKLQVRPEGGTAETVTTVSRVGDGPPSPPDADE